MFLLYNNYKGLFGIKEFKHCLLVSHKQFFKFVFEKKDGLKEQIFCLTFIFKKNCILVNLIIFSRPISEWERDKFRSLATRRAPIWTATVRTRAPWTRSGTVECVSGWTNNARNHALLMEFNMLLVYYLLYVSNYYIKQQKDLICKVW